MYCTQKFKNSRPIKMSIYSRQQPISCLKIKPGEQIRKKELKKPVHSYEENKTIGSLNEQLLWYILFNASE